MQEKDILNEFKKYIQDKNVSQIIYNYIFCSQDICIEMKDHSFALFNIDSNCVSKQFEYGHTDKINGFYIFSKRNEVLSWSNDGTIRLWNKISGKCIKIFKALFDYDYAHKVNIM